MMEVWNPKIQLCWWHLKKAVRERMKKTKLSTTPYNVVEAHAEFPFIDPQFTPNGRSDVRETEGLPVSSSPVKELDAVDEPDAGPRQFCPERYWDTILELIEKHFCAHPSANVHFTYLIGISEKRHQKAGISGVSGQ